MTPTDGQRFCLELLIPFHTVSATFLSRRYSESAGIQNVSAETSHLEVSAGSGCLSNRGNPPFMRVFTRAETKFPVFFPVIAELAYRQAAS